MVYMKVRSIELAKEKGICISKVCDDALLVAVGQDTSISDGDELDKMKQEKKEMSKIIKEKEQILKKNEQEIAQNEAKIAENEQKREENERKWKERFAKYAKEDDETR